MTTSNSIQKFKLCHICHSLSFVFYDIPQTCAFRESDHLSRKPIFLLQKIDKHLGVRFLKIKHRSNAEKEKKKIVMTEGFEPSPFQTSALN